MRKKIGIIGGGQLGRMFIQAAIDFDMEIHILDPDPSAPCREIAASFVVGERTDYEAVYNFGKTMDVVTIEIENVNTDALQQLVDEGIKVYPQPSVVATIKDKRLQKQFYAQHNIPTADFVLTDSVEEVKANLNFLPAFQKLGTGGYDGQGVQLLKNEADLPKAFKGLSLLEKLVDIDKELSVIVARNESGEIQTFPVVELVFDPVYNLVDYLLAPAQISEAIEEKAAAIATQVIEAFDMVGLLAVELFLTKSGEILVNEVAPRPHNSGHQTIKANYTSQYEQHLRSIMNFPLGDTQLKTNTAMINIIGSQGHKGEAHYVGHEKVLQTSGAFIHLYGKKLTKPGRKMGHITVLDKDMESLKQKVKMLKGAVNVITE